MKSVDRPKLHEARANHSSCSMGSKVYVFAGNIEDKVMKTNTVEFLDTANEQKSSFRWHLISFDQAEIDGRRLPVFCPINDEEILIFGG